VRGQAEKKVLTKDLLCPISSEPKVIAMGFAPSLISLRKNTEVEERSGGEGGSVVGRNASRR
jgi:proteasome assembly chaperone (PAC2) family protein